MGKRLSAFEPVMLILLSNCSGLLIYGFLFIHRTESEYPLWYSPGLSPGTQDRGKLNHHFCFSKWLIGVSHGT